jgi:hypothetical protein
MPLGSVGARGTTGGKAIRAKAIAFAALCLCLTLAATASAATPVAPYDGQNPFRCKVQNVGTGTNFPDPDADPFCVEFNKRSQNVTDLGIVDFLLKEPARVAAASLKCFYHQTDHWTGSIVQGQPPELWHWDGRYFFDKAKAVGGVSLSNVRFGGVSIDPRTLPGFPMQLWPYFGPGGGGVRLVNLGAAEPLCAAKVDTPEEARRIYRQPPLY